MRTFTYLVTLTWHERGGAVHTRTAEGKYEAEAFEPMTSVRENIRQEARDELGIPHRTEDAVLLFWVVPDRLESE